MTEGIRTPPQTPRRITERRAYDVGELTELLRADLRILLHPVEPSGELVERCAYWIARAWDAGRSAAEIREVRRG